MSTTTDGSPVQPGGTAARIAPVNSSCEHAQAAQRLGAALATPENLVRDGERLRLRLGGGATAPVDVVYRRTNEDRLRGDDSALTAVAELLLEPWLGGALGLVNAYGNGVADDKLFHSHVEDSSTSAGSALAVRLSPLTHIGVHSDRGDG